jgi:hypothetical protein
MHVYKLCSLGFKLNVFYVLLPEDGSQSPKHGVKTAYLFYIFCVCANSWFLKTRSKFLLVLQLSCLWSDRLRFNVTKMLSVDEDSSLLGYDAVMLVGPEILKDCSASIFRAKQFKKHPLDPEGEGSMFA